MANSNPPAKCLSFDSRFHDETNNSKNNEDKDIGKSYSFAGRAPSDFSNNNNTDDSRSRNKPFTAIDEGDEEHDHEQHNAKEEEEEEEVKEFTLEQLSYDIDQFVISLSSTNEESEPPEITHAVAKFLKKIEAKIEEYESNAQYSVVFGRDVEEDASFIAAVNRLYGLMDALHRIKSSYLMPLLNQTSSVLHHAMVFLEEELRLILEESVCQNSNNTNDSSSSKHTDSSLKGLKGRLQSFASSSHQDDSGRDSCDLQSQENPDPESEDQQEGKDTTNNNNNNNSTFPFFSADSVSSIRLIANAMISAGYETECCNVFLITRRHAFEEELRQQGFDKISTDDVQKMNWEALEGEIATWIRLFKHCTSTLFPGEETFYESVFPHHISTSQYLYSDLSSSILSILVNFAEAVALTKRATEKLFKFLDMYEALCETLPWVETKSLMYSSVELMEELKSELLFAKSRLGEAAVSIFCQFENSIKSDNTKTPVASGAVHPLTRYTMNYLKYACEYKDTLEQVFQQHLRTDQTEEYSVFDHSSSSEQQHHNNNNRHEEEEKHSPFATQLITIMDLLDSYLESKSKLYKDLSLRYIFLMNNGRYMLQKVKGSTEIHQVVGDNWCRRRSSDVRHYHKSYQRETWSRVLQCLNQEGLQVNGKIHKPILKERFKNFNQLFDEIHRTQSTWVVSDEQLQSELRVSISAVMIPAYRSFVARFGQIFTPGRQVEKYIKFQPDDIEAIIEELFDGNPSSIPRRKI